MVVFLFIQQCFYCIYIIFFFTYDALLVHVNLPSYWQKHEVVYVKRFTRDNCSVIPALAPCNEPGTLLGLHERQCVCTECVGLIMHSVCVCVCVVGGGGGCGVIGRCIIALLCYQRYFGGCASQASHLLITQGLSVPFSVQSKRMAWINSVHVHLLYTEKPRKLLKHIKMFNSSQI